MTPRLACAALCLVAQSCPTLCDPMDCSLPGSSVHGILQARILQCVAISFSRDLLDPGIKPGSPALQADSSPKPGLSVLHPNSHHYEEVSVFRAMAASAI